MHTPQDVKTAGSRLTDDHNAPVQRCPQAVRRVHVHTRARAAMQRVRLHRRRRQQRQVEGQEVPARRALRLAGLDFQPADNERFGNLRQTQPRHLRTIGYDINRYCMIIMLMFDASRPTTGVLATCARPSRATCGANKQIVFSLVIHIE